MEISVTAADGTRLVARRTGRGTPVVLVHGSAGGLDSWDPIMGLLEDRFELWTYARRGYAPSDGCRRPKTYADDVLDLRAVLASAGGSAHVVGASYGATVALHAACAPGVAIRSVALFEPPLFTAGAASATVLGPYRRLLDAGDLATATRLFAEEVARVPAAMLAALDAAAATQNEPAATQNEPAATQNEAADDAAARDEAVGCLHDLEAMAADDPDISRWGCVDVPVLLIQGEQTWAPLPATMDTLAGALPAAARVVLPGQSHFATHTGPDLFAEALRGFLHDRR